MMQTRESSAINWSNSGVLDSGDGARRRLPPRAGVSEEFPGGDDSVVLVMVLGDDADSERRRIVGRMKLGAWMAFVPLWHTFSYTVGTFSVWSPNGWLAKMGVIDFAEGFVFHLSSSVAGFTFLIFADAIQKSIEAMQINSTDCFGTIAQNDMLQAVDSKREGQQSSLRQWALSLIGDLALHELVDPRLSVWTLKMIKFKSLSKIWTLKMIRCKFV